MTWYDLVAAACLSVAGAATILSVAGAALQQVLGGAAAAICAVVFLIPGLYFVGYAERLRTRDLALAHAAAFARTRGTLAISDLAGELRVPRADAEKILRTAVREGHLEGSFDERGRFVASREGREESP